MKTLFALLVLFFVSSASGQLLNCNPYDSTISVQTVRANKGEFKKVFNTHQASVFFKRGLIDSLYQRDTATHVRLYFILPVDSVLPCNPRLVMIPYSQANCDLDIYDTVLFSTYGSGTTSYLGPAGKDSLVEPFIWWQEQYEQNMFLADSFNVVYGYNYKWDSLFAACTHGDTLHDLAVKFGIKTNEIAPGDDTTKAYTLDLYLTTPAGQDAAGNQSFYDFSRPCPHFCGLFAIDPRAILEE